MRFSPKRSGGTPGDLERPAGDLLHLLLFNFNELTALLLPSPLFPTFPIHTL
jgi:hypothetical protein